MLLALRLTFGGDEAPGDSICQFRVISAGKHAEAISRVVTQFIQPPAAKAVGCTSHHCGCGNLIQEPGRQKECRLQIDRSGLFLADFLSTI